MSAKIKFEIDGEFYGPDELCWMEQAPCGCWAGITLSIGDRLSEADQWAHLEHADVLLEIANEATS